MSLINKVLLDLDNRTQGGAITANQTLFSRLHPVGVPSSSLSSKWTWVLLACLIMVGVAAGGWYVKNSLWLAPVKTAINHATTTRSKVVKATAPDKSPASHTKITPSTATEIKSTPTQPTDKPVEQAHPTQNESADLSQTTTVVTTPKMQTHATESQSAPVEEPSLKRTLLPIRPKEKAEKLYRKGVNLIRSGQVKEGERTLQSALVIDPSHRAARETLSVVLLQNHRFEEAKHILAEGIALDPSYAPFTSRLARLYIEQGDETRALRLLERNRTLTTPDAAYLGLLGTLYQREEKPEEARDAFREALGLQPDEGRWWMGLGISLEALRDWPAARDAYQRCLMISQTDPRVHQYAEQRLSIVSRHLK